MDIEGQEKETLTYAPASCHTGSLLWADRVVISLTPLKKLLSARLCKLIPDHGEGPVMAISQDLLEILACPACKAKVELKPDGSALKCVECKRVYPIRDDIPVMLIDEATIEDEQPESK